MIADTGTFSNLFNTIRWAPLPWLSLSVVSQVPLFDHGFYQINNTLSFQVTRDLTVGLGERYINGNSQFQDSNLITLSGYYRINDNWAFAAAEQYEFATSTLEQQTYTISRDLSSWIASIGFDIGNSGGVKSYGVILSFTLKDLPNVRLPLTLDPNSLSGLTSGSKNK